VSSQPITRRRFLTGSLAATGALALGACTSDGAKAKRPKRAATRPAAAAAPFDTVVLLTMENRSFDHLLGWLSGADGQQAGLSYTDSSGAAHPTWSIAPDWQGWRYGDPGTTGPQSPNSGTAARATGS
jgi:phospholipase C